MIVFKVFLVYLLNILQVFFKPKKALIIHSFPDFDDMTKAIIKENKELKIVVLTTGVKTPPKWMCNYDVVVVNKKSLRGVCAYLSSRYILFTHGLYGSFNRHKKKIVINLWHGMPLKNIGYLDDIDSNCTQYCDYILSTGSVFSKVMAKAFRVDEKNVVEIGLPRNDLLEHKEEKEKYIMMLPTYRSSNSRVDGAALKGVFGINVFELSALNDVLLGHGVKLYIKPHPMEKQESNSFLEGFSNISVINSEFLTQKNITLYEMLSCSSMLITDLSSVIFDYWLTEKPIVIFFPDYNEYTLNRGFTIEFNYKEIFNQFYNQNSRELITTIDNVLSKKLEWKFQWNSLGFHTHRYQSSKRLFDLINSIEEQLH